MLTDHQIALLQNLADGLTNDQIARKHNTPVNTMKGKLRRIYRILDAANAVNAVAIGFRNGHIT